MKKILVSTTIILMMLLLVGCNDKKENIEDKIEILENTKLNDKQNLDGLEFSNDIITYDGANTELVSTAKNITNETKELTWVKATIKYEDFNKIEKEVELLIYFGEKIPSGEVRTTTTIVDTDLRKTIEVKYQIVK